MVIEQAWGGISWYVHDGMDDIKSKSMDGG